MSRHQDNKTSSPETLPSGLIDDLALSLEPIAPPPDRAQALKSRVMTAARETPQADAAATTAEEAIVLRTGINLPVLRHAASWQWTTLLPGVEQCILLESGHRRTRLLKLAPGSCLPPHRHSYDEESFLVDGTAVIGDTQVDTGGYQFMPAGTLHPLITSEEGCLVLVIGEKLPTPVVNKSLLRHLFGRLFGTRRS